MLIVSFLIFVLNMIKPYVFFTVALRNVKNNLLATAGNWHSWLWIAFSGNILRSMLKFLRLTREITNFLLLEESPIPRSGIQGNGVTMHGSATHGQTNIIAPLNTFQN